MLGHGHIVKMQYIKIFSSSFLGQGLDKLSIYSYDNQGRF